MAYIFISTNQVNDAAMKSIRDNTRRADGRQRVVVEITITVDEVEAMWLIENSEPIGSTPQRIASQIVSDVIRDDMLAHNEAITLQ